VARRARVAALAFVAALVSSGGSARAQTYATLHVRSFTMSVDRASVAVGEPFHLTIAAHVDERVVQLDNLTLPDLSGFESLGDERRCVASATGSDCVEIVSLSPTIAGRRTIPGATLDAIDGRNGKPSRFTTDAIVLDVSGPPGDPLGDGITSFFFGAIRAGVVFVLVVIGVFALIWGFASRRRSPSAVGPLASAYVAPVEAAADPFARYRELVDALAREPSRANVLRVREAMRAGMFARDEETYGDLVARGAADPTVLDALRAVERAAFCEDDRVADAAREALPFLNR
jgi:hypothetical protein